VERQEFFLLLPAIIYAVAVVDLLKVFSHKKNYLEMVAWGALLMVYVIILWLELWSKLELIGSNKWFFIMIIAKAILLSQIARVITPEQKDTDTKAYFLATRKNFFLLVATLTLFNLLIQELAYNDHRPLPIRLAIIALLIASAFIDKIWVRWGTWTIVMAFLIFILVSIQ